jgi:hypothetical protein
MKGPRTHTCGDSFLLDHSCAASRRRACALCLLLDSWGLRTLKNRSLLSRCRNIATSKPQKMKPFAREWKISRNKPSVGMRSAFRASGESEFNDEVALAKQEGAEQGVRTHAGTVCSLLV